MKPLPLKLAEMMKISVRSQMGATRAAVVYVALKGLIVALYTFILLHIFVSVSPLLIACLVGGLIWVLALPSHIASCRSYQELVDANTAINRVSRTDSLTGLRNRRAFFDDARQLPKGLIHAVFMVIDIDRFKLINDTHGHVAGDQVIAEIGGLLHRAFPAGSIVGRIGGEEFAAIIPNATILEARLAYDQIRHDLAILPPRYGATAIPTTLSAGIAVIDFAKNGVAIEEAYAEADKALYVAKISGRNTAIIAKDMSAIINRSLEPETMEIAWRDDVAEYPRLRATDLG